MKKLQLTIILGTFLFFASCVDQQEPLPQEELNTLDEQQILGILKESEG